jgi:DinB superfamily
MLPGLAQLETTPEIFRILFEGLTHEEANWKPSADRWCIAEVIEHLSHVEGHGFRSRIDQMLAEDMPVLKEYNQEKFAAAGQYSGRDIEDSFDHWEDQRVTNIEYLRNLNETILARSARHERLGILTIADLLNEWAFHDLGHLRQVMELIRSRRYYPQMGPYQTIYQIHP